MPAELLLWWLPCYLRVVDQSGSGVGATFTCKVQDAATVITRRLLSFADRATNMHMLQPVFLPLDQESASPEKLADFMGYLDKQGQTGLRLLAATGPDVRKVLQLRPACWGT